MEGWGRLVHHAPSSYRHPTERERERGAAENHSYIRPPPFTTLTCRSAVLHVRFVMSEEFAARLAQSAGHVMRGRCRRQTAEGARGKLNHRVEAVTWFRGYYDNSWWESGRCLLLDGDALHCTVLGENLADNKVSVYWFQYWMIYPNTATRLIWRKWSPLCLLSLYLGAQR